MKTSDPVRVNTEYGTANLSHGYLRITSYKEGNYGKAVHRLVFEDYYNYELDITDEVHHIDGNKLNNDPLNLVRMSKSDHTALHMTGRVLSEDSKKKIGDSHKNKEATVIKNGFKRGKQVYSIYKDCRVIKSSINLNKLFDWFELNYPAEEMPKFKSKTHGGKQ